MLVRLRAVLYGLRIDRDGETRLTLEVPLNQLPEAAKLCSAVQKVLDVTLQETESGVIGGTRAAHESD